MAGYDHPRILKPSFPSSGVYYVPPPPPPSGDADTVRWAIEHAPRRPDLTVVTARWFPGPKVLAVRLRLDTPRLARMLEQWWIVRGWYSARAPGSEPPDFLVLQGCGNDPAYKVIARDEYACLQCDGRTWRAIWDVLKSAQQSDSGEYWMAERLPEGSPAYEKNNGDGPPSIVYKSEDGNGVVEVLDKAREAEQAKKVSRRYPEGYPPTPIEFSGDDTIAAADDDEGFEGLPPDYRYGSPVDVVGRWSALPFTVRAIGYSALSTSVGLGAWLAAKLIGAL